MNITLFTLTHDPYGTPSGKPPRTYHMLHQDLSGNGVQNFDGIRNFLFELHIRSRTYFRAQDRVGHNPLFCARTARTLYWTCLTKSHPIEVEHPSGEPAKRASRTIGQFVDDQPNGAVKARDEVAECIHKLEDNTNMPNNLLNASGGG